MLFNGGAAMHSRTYTPDGSLLDATLGRPASHGCVRMKQEDIDWLAKYIPLGTTVVVY
jgi:lipoprotein-anchoring transpeptidase ErfK/SrfK